MAVLLSECAANGGNATERVKIWHKCTLWDIRTDINESEFLNNMGDTSEKKYISHISYRQIKLHRNCVSVTYNTYLILAFH